MMSFNPICPVCELEIEGQQVEREIEHLDEAKIEEIKRSYGTHDECAAEPTP